MSDNLMDKVTAFGEQLKISGAEVGRKMSEGMSSMSFKVRELFQGQNQAEKIVEEATAETLERPDWAANLEICDMINSEKINSVELIRGIKKRIALKNVKVQYLAMVLLETCVKNCEKAFSEVASERVLDDLVKLIDGRDTVVINRNKALMLIESWGELGSELRYLPVFEETYKSLKSRGVCFPGRDNESLAPIFTTPRSVSSSEPNADSTTLHDHLNVPIPVLSFSPEQTKEAFDVARNSIELLSTVLSSAPQKDALKDELVTTLVQQCRQSQSTVQRLIETTGKNEVVLFEALNLNDEILMVLSKYEELKQPIEVPPDPQAPMIPIALEPDEPAHFGKEEALTRKSAGSRARGAVDEDKIVEDLDEMIFGKKREGSSEGQDRKKQQHKDYLI